MNLVFIWRCYMLNSDVYSCHYMYWIRRKFLLLWTTFALSDITLYFVYDFKITILAFKLLLTCRNIRVWSHFVCSIICLTWSGLPVSCQFVFWLLLLWYSVDCIVCSSACIRMYVYCMDDFVITITHVILQPLWMRGLLHKFRSIVRYTILLYDLK